MLYVSIQIINIKKIALRLLYGILDIMYLEEILIVQNIYHIFRDIITAF